MDEEEAEAALRAIGEQLRWITLGRRTWAVFTLPDGFRGRYFVHEIEVKGTQSKAATGAGNGYRYDAEVLISRDLRKNAPGFKTQAEAKAACERHHTTGNWDCA